MRKWKLKNLGKGDIKGRQIGGKGRGKKGGDREKWGKRRLKNKEKARERESMGGETVVLGSESKRDRVDVMRSD